MLFAATLDHWFPPTHEANKHVHHGNTLRAAGDVRSGLNVEPNR